MGARPPGMDDKTYKTHIELFAGNLPPDSSAESLKDFINAAMIETKLNTHPGINRRCDFCLHLEDSLEGEFFLPRMANRHSLP